MTKKMKLMKLAVAVGLVTVLAAGCTAGKKAETSEDISLQKITDKKELVLGLDDSFPPMGYKDENNNVVGFDIDVATEVCQRLGVSLKIQPIDWDAKEQELNTGNIDCIWNGLSYNEERDKAMQLSEPYMKNRQLAVVLADSPVNALTDLAGKTVVVQTGSTASEAVGRDPEFEKSLGDFVKVSDNVQAMMDLKIAGSDAVVMDEVVARFYTEKEEGVYRILEEALADENYVIGFRKKDTALCEEVNKTLKAMAADGSLKTIAEKWFGEDITTIK